MKNRVLIKLSGSGDGLPDPGEGGRCTKESYWNSTSAQTIFGKLHPVGVAVRVALGSIYKSDA